MRNPIRVLHVFGRLDSGGAESRTMDIYRNIDREKVQFDFVIHTEDKCFYTDEVHSLGGRIFSLPRFNGTNILEYKKSWGILLDEHPEYKIIHGHQTNTGFIYLKEAMKKHVPIRIAHSRNSNKENFVKKHLGKLSRFYATHLFAVSKLAGISEFGESAVKNGKVKVIPNAIDTNKYVYDPDIRAKMRVKLNVNDKELLIGHIGRFHPQKNHVFLLKVFKKIQDKHRDSKLILIGDGPLKTEIVKQIKDLNIEDSVILTGIRDNVPDFLQAIDILLFPSHFEGLPGVVLEAQAAGVQCVISDTITNEVMVTNLVDYVSLDKPSEEWADIVLKRSKNLNRRNTYNEIVKSGYDINSVAQWYQDFYIDAISKENI